jgi:hypothetical protein
MGRSTLRASSAAFAVLVLVAGCAGESATIAPATGSASTDHSGVTSSTSRAPDDISGQEGTSTSAPSPSTTSSQPNGSAGPGSSAAAPSAAQRHLQDTFPQIDLAVNDRDDEDDLARLLTEYFVVQAWISGHPLHPPGELEALIAPLYCEGYIGSEPDTNLMLKTSSELVAAGERVVTPPATVVEILLDERVEEPPYIYVYLAIDYVGDIAFYDLELGTELMSFVGGGAEPLQLTLGWAQFDGSDWCVKLENWEQLD